MYADLQAGHGQRFRATVRFALAVALGSGALAACQDPVQPTESAAPAPARSVAPTAQQPGAVKTIDDEFLELAQHAPGFAGMYIDDAGALTVAVTDRADVGKVSDSVRAYVGRRWSSRSTLVTNALPKLRTVRAAYAFNQLASWYTALGTAVPKIGLAFTGIDKQHNRLLIGVVDGTAAARVRAALPQVVGLPPAAVDVVIVGRLRLHQQTNIRQLTNPVIAGVMIARPISANEEEACTLGANVQPAGSFYPTFYIDYTHRYFITASHCTGTQSQYNGSLWYQPTTFGGGRFLGREAFNPPWGPETSDYYAERYRWSDAAIIQYDDATFAASDRDFGGLAQIADGTQFEIGSVFRITTDGEQTQVQGAYVMKVGQKTGATSGTVTQTCLNVYVTTSPDPIRALYCQTLATLSSDQGDSGAPVYSIRSDGSASMEGTLVGGYDLQGPYYNNTVYSSTRNIYLDFVPTFGVPYYGPYY